MVKSATKEERRSGQEMASTTAPEGLNLDVLDAPADPKRTVIYVRQSTLVQVERNRESTARQYDLVSRARELGWPRSAVTVIDEDLGVSGASAAGRSGFAQLAARLRQECAIPPQAAMLSCGRMAACGRCAHGESTSLTDTKHANSLR
jgi:Resolvase, N terminal domain